MMGHLKMPSYYLKLLKGMEILKRKAVVKQQVSQLKKQQVERLKKILMKCRKNRLSLLSRSRSTGKFKINNIQYFYIGQKL